MCGCNALPLCGALGARLRAERGSRQTARHVVSMGDKRHVMLLVYIKWRRARIRNRARRHMTVPSLPGLGDMRACKCCAALRFSYRHYVSARV